MTHCLASTLRGAILAVGVFGFFTAQAGAQSNPDLIYLQDRIERLEAQMQIRGAGGGAVPIEDSSEAALSLRISQLEEQMRRLNGQVEQFAHIVRRLEERLGISGGAATLIEGAGGAEGGQPQPSDSMASGSGDELFATGQDLGSQPQILGQVPGQPLDLSGALDQSIDGLGNASEFSQPPGGNDTLLAAAPSSGDPRSDYDAAYGHVLRGQFDVAEASFRQFLDAYPEDELAGNAQYWLGESLYARGRYRDAADAFLAGYTEYPDSAKAPDSLFKLGMSLKELGQRDAACATLAEIGRKYPEASPAVRERAQSELDKSGC